MFPKELYNFLKMLYITFFVNTCNTRNYSVLILKMLPFELYILHIGIFIFQKMKIKMAGFLKIILGIE